MLQQELIRTYSSCLPSNITWRTLREKWERSLPNATSFLENDMVILVPDFNPMSNLSYMGTETIQALDLPVEPEKSVLHSEYLSPENRGKNDPAKDQTEQDFDILVGPPRPWA